MTGNQIKYAEHLENVRHNVADEAETKRFHIVTSTETERSNRAREVETHRSNLVQEAIGWDNARSHRIQANAAASSAAANWYSARQQAAIGWYSARSQHQERIARIRQADEQTAYTRESRAYISKQYGQREQELNTQRNAQLEQERHNRQMERVGMAQAAKGWMDTLGKAGRNALEFIAKGK